MVTCLMLAPAGAEPERHGRTTGGQEGRRKKAPPNEKSFLHLSPFLFRKVDVATRLKDRATSAQCTVQVNSPATKR